MTITADVVADLGVDEGDVTASLNCLTSCRASRRRWWVQVFVSHAGRDRA
jgi:hypothetical protein